MRTLGDRPQDIGPGMWRLARALHTDGAHFGAALVAHRLAEMLPGGGADLFLQAALRETLGVLHEMDPPGEVPCQRCKDMENLFKINLT